MKLRTLTLALVALCLTIVASAHPIGKYIRHRNIVTADHIYSYNGHGHDKYSKVYNPHGKDKNFYHCNGLDHHVTCKHGTCHNFYNGHHRSKHACRTNCHDHGFCKPHSGSSCGHHDRYAHPCDQRGHGCEEKSCCDKKEEAVEVEATDTYQGDSKRATIRIKED